MEYTRMPVIAWSELYDALGFQYGSQFVDEEDLSEVISKDSCSEDELVYFYIYNDKNCDTDDISGSIKANVIRGYLRNIFPGEHSVIIDFVI